MKGYASTLTVGGKQELIPSVIANQIYTVVEVAVCTSGKIYYLGNISISNKSWPKYSICFTFKLT